MFVKLMELPLKKRKEVQKPGVWIQIGPKMKHLRDFRECFEWEMKDFADDCGVSQAAVSHWELGRCEPRKKQRTAIAKVLELSSPDQVVFISLG